MRIYVSNLAVETTHADLRTAFATYGDVEKVGLARTRPSDRDTTYALIEMSDESEAVAAIADMNGARLHERSIRVRGPRNQK